MDIISRSFRLERNSTVKLGRSNSSLLISESISSECARFTGYERLSKSISISSSSTRLDAYKSKQSRASELLCKVFSFRKVSRDSETIKRAKLVIQEEKKQKKKQSSWRPDPESRWPVQGW